jgi:Rhodopirellula transposase DDE domain
VKRSALDEDTFLRFFQTLDERQARLCAAERALAIGRGGITLVSRVTGLSYPTIHKGITELRNTAATLTTGRIRRPGGGRKKVEVVDPAVLPILQQVVESSTAGSPMDALRWTSKSKTNLAEALAERGHRLAPNTVGRLLRDLGYSLQANRELNHDALSSPESAIHSDPERCDGDSYQRAPVAWLTPPAIARQIGVSVSPDYAGATFLRSTRNRE